MAPKRNSKPKALLNVIIGKNPGETLLKKGRSAYSLEAQRTKCISHFDYKFGKKMWEVSTWYVRDVSARTSPQWFKELQKVCEQTQGLRAILAASNVCQILQNRKARAIIEDAKVPLMICDIDAIDTTTVKGRHRFAEAVNDAQLEAELGAERAKVSHAVPKKRGKNSARKALR